MDCPYRCAHYNAVRFNRWSTHKAEASVDALAYAEHHVTVGLRTTRWLQRQQPQLVTILGEKKGIGLGPAWKILGFAGLAPIGRENQKRMVFEMMSSMELAVQHLRIPAAKILQANLRALDGPVKRPFTLARLPVRSVGAKEQRALVKEGLIKQTQAILDSSPTTSGQERRVDVLGSDGAYCVFRSVEPGALAGVADEMAQEEHEALREGLRDGDTNAEPTTVVEAGLRVIAQSKLDHAAVKADPPAWVSSVEFRDLVGIQGTREMPQKMLDAALYLGEFVSNVRPPDTVKVPQLRGWNLHRKAPGAAPVAEQPMETETLPVLPAATDWSIPTDPGFAKCVLCGFWLEQDENGCITNVCTKRKADGVTKIQLHEQKNRTMRNKLEKAANAAIIDAAAAAAVAAAAYATSAAGQAEKAAALSVAARADADEAATVQAAAAAMSDRARGKRRQVATSRASEAAALAVSRAAALALEASEAAVVAHSQAVAEAEEAANAASTAEVKLLLDEMLASVVACETAHVTLNSVIAVDTPEEYVFWSKYAPHVAAVSTAEWHADEARRLFDRWSATKSIAIALEREQGDVPVAVQMELQEHEAVSNRQEQRSSQAEALAQAALILASPEIRRAEAVVEHARAVRGARHAEARMVIPLGVPDSALDEASLAALKSSEEAERALASARKALSELLAPHEEVLTEADEIRATGEFDVAEADEEGSECDAGDEGGNDDEKIFFTGASFLFGRENAGGKLNLPPEESKLFESMRQMRPPPTQHPIDTELPNVAPSESLEERCKRADLLADLISGDEPGTSHIWSTMRLSGAMPTLLGRLDKMIYNVRERGTKLKVDSIRFEVHRVRLKQYLLELRGRGIDFDVSSYITPGVILQICYDHTAKNTCHNFCNQTETADCPVKLSNVLAVVKRMEALSHGPRKGRWRRHSKVLLGAVDKQKTGAYIAVFTDRELHAELLADGHTAEWAFFRVFADGHEAFDMAGLTVQDRTWRLFKVSYMLSCLFGDRFEVCEWGLWMHGQWAQRGRVGWRGGWCGRGCIHASRPVH